MNIHYAYLADVVLALHVLIVAFVVIGLILILLAGLLGWHWIRNFWFRLTHLAAIGIVVAQAWLGRLCPLTIVEAWLRQQAGLETYEETFIQYWLQRVLYYDFPLWVFAAAYTLFGFLVIAAWSVYPPRARHSSFRSN